MSQTQVGLVGCGNVSEIYLQNAELFRSFEIVACADYDFSRAQAAASRYGVEPLSTDQLLGRPDIEVVLNLTPPAAHFDVGMATVAAGKHLFSEKPLTMSFSQALQLAKAAEAAGIRVACAPDTILGPSVQAAAHALESGRIGVPSFATSMMLYSGMESWHPKPDFFYSKGNGPVMDMGPYYVAALITMLGSVESVSAVGGAARKRRQVTAPTSPMVGQFIPVEENTTVQATLRFRNGVHAMLVFSWDFWTPYLAQIQVVGDQATLVLGDPCFFGEDVKLYHPDGSVAASPLALQPFGKPNFPLMGAMVANYRGLGLAEMADAIAHHRRHVLSLELALHTLEVLETIVGCARMGAPVKKLETAVEFLPRLAEPERLMADSV